MTHKQSLLLLHGALADKNQFKSLIPQLSKRLDAHAINFEGHGKQAAIARPFHIKFFVQNVLDYLDKKAIEKTNIFGYSMGGYVALTLAKNHSHRVEKIATLGTILQWDEEKAQSECRYLKPEKIMEKVPHFARKLDEQHKCGWKTMVNKTGEMLRYLGKTPNLTDKDWKELQHFIRLYVGDRDSTAGLESTVEIYRKLTKGELCVLPDTAHSFNNINKGKLAQSLLTYIKVKKI